MLADYNEYTYMANVDRDTVTLITFDTSKRLEGFEKIRYYYKKVVSLDDAELTALYDIHYKVKYYDSIETTEIWNIDEGRPVGLLPNIEENEVVIAVDHDAMDDTWTQFEKYAAAKKINLTDCIAYYIEKVYWKRNGVVEDGKVEEREVSINALKQSMVSIKRGNL